MLPAKDGDCLILTWGDGTTNSHAVIDGGRASAHPHLHDHLAKFAEAGEQLELYVLTHIDADHIEGALQFLRSRNRPLMPKRVWYNGFHQLRPGDRRSMRQGDDYSVELDKLRWPLNEDFERGVVSIETAPAEIDVEGLIIRILSPGTAHLEALGAAWEKWRIDEEEKRRRTEENEGRENTRGGKRDRPPVPDPLVVEALVEDGETDSELPNGSSIAFVADWSGKRILLAGDAHPDLLAASLSGLVQDGARYHLDLLKASHHGSTKNTTRELVELIDCKRLAISTNGNIHGHPDPQAIARFIQFGTEGRKHLHFNYRTSRTLPWDAENVKDRYNYETHYPTETEGELSIDLL